MSCLSLPGPYCSFPAGLVSLAGIVRSDPWEECRKVMVILTIGWSMSDGQLVNLWQDDGRGCLMASFSPPLIGLYEYLMKSRRNSIRSFTCCIFREGRRKRNGRILLDSSSHRVETECPESLETYGHRCQSYVSSPGNLAKQEEINPFYQWDTVNFQVPCRQMDFIWRGKTSMLKHQTY